MYNIIPGATGIHLKNNVIIRQNQHGLTKGKLHLINLMSSNKRRNLDRLDHWDMIKRIKLTNSKYWILHCDGITPSTRIIWKGDWRENCRKGSRGAVDSRLSGNQMCFLEAKRANCILRGIKEHHQPVKTGDNPLVFRIGAASSGVWCTVLGPTT